MKKYVVGAEFMSGIGANTGKPFKFGQVGIANEIEQVSKEKFTLIGGGLSIANKGKPYVYGASLEVVRSIMALNPPCFMDVEFAPSDFGGDGAMDVVAVRAIPVAAAVRAAA